MIENLYRKSREKTATAVLFFSLCNISNLFLHISDQGADVINDQFNWGIFIYSSIPFLIIVSPHLFIWIIKDIKDHRGK